MNNITFGQFILTDSHIHKADPRTKILFLIAYIVLIFSAQNFASLALLAVLMVIVIILTKIPLRMYLKNIKAILPIIILTAVLNAFYTSSGKVLISFWVITITYGGVERSVFMAARIILLILASAMLSYTTTPTALTGAIESLLSPLSYIGLKQAVHTLAMTMTIALRFIPTLISETNKIMSAQKARGADLESGNLIQKVKALLPILIPLLVSSVRRAYELAESMECRCYNGADGRTKLNVLRFGVRDLIAGVVFAVSTAGVIILNILF